MAKKKRDFDKPNWEVTWTTLGRGCWIICCWSPECQKPLGHVIFNALGKSRQTKKVRIEVLSSFTEPFARRTGVRTYLNEKLFQYWKPDVITTMSGTRYGEPWMKARGYQISSEFGGWFVTKEAFEASTKPPV